MMLSAIRTQTRSLPAYVSYFVLVFGWYFLDNMYLDRGGAAPDSSRTLLLNWADLLLLAPLILAGVFGGIHEQQRIQQTSSFSGFLRGVRLHYWRILGANFLAIILFIAVGIVFLIAASPEQSDEASTKLGNYLDLPMSAILLFWFAGIVVERRIFRSLLHAVKLLVFNPYALAIGVVWALARFADHLVAEAISGQTSVALNALRAGCIAAVRVAATAYSLVVYRQAWREDSIVTSEVSAPAPASGDGLVNAGFGFAFFSFLPLVHLIALVLGVLALRGKRRFVFRSAIASLLGGFFTLYYLLLIMGWLLSASASASSPGYAFLAEVDADLEPYVALLEQGSSEDVRLRLAQSAINDAEHSWGYDLVSALGNYLEHDLDAALEDFSIAAKSEPERSEFYYYYGMALLENDEADKAAAQFRNALLHEPRLEEAERHLALLDSTYSPSVFASSLSLVIILLGLFTVHEYGHAYAAWKLGDDTAKNQGRLTLNPLPHLELFGSIVLPAILLWRQSAVVFGWAKPVPVNPMNFQDPRRDHMRVSFAGPAMNLIVCMACFLILACIMLIVRLFWPETLSLNFATPSSPVSLVGPPLAGWLVMAVVFLKQLFYTSLILGCFNLIPIPPLDGSWILAGLLPGGLRALFEKTRRYAFVLFLVLMVTPVFDYILALPIGLAWGGLQLLVSVMGLG